MMSGQVNLLVLMCDSTQSIAHQVLPNLLYPEFLLMFHYVGMADQIIGHMTQTQNWPSSLLQGQIDITWLKISTL